MDRTAVDINTISISSSLVSDVTAARTDGRVSYDIVINDISSVRVVDD